MYCDSAAALGITNRLGIGKIRHPRTQGLCVQEVRESGRTAYRKVLGEKRPADLLTKHLGAEVISRHVDTLNMIWIEGRAESAPTLESMESYVQPWIEDCAYVDEGSDNGECDADINENEKEQNGERKKVRFLELIIVRPMPAVGNGKTTPVRGASAVSTKWHSERNANIGNIDRQVVNRQCREQIACICGGQLRKGDGKPWSDAEGDKVCLACASRWHVPTREPSVGAQQSIDSVEITHWPVSPEWVVDQRGVQIQEDKFGPRVRPVFP